jgi:hypothetical protein
LTPEVLSHPERRKNENQDANIPDYFAVEFAPSLLAREFVRHAAPSPPAKTPAPLFSAALDTT